MLHHNLRSIIGFLLGIGSIQKFLGIEKDRYACLNEMDAIREWNESRMRNGMLFSSSQAKKWAFSGCVYIKRQALKSLIIIILSLKEPQAGKFLLKRKQTNWKLTRAIIHCQKHDCGFYPFNPQTLNCCKNGRKQTCSYFMEIGINSSKTFLYCYHFLKISCAIGVYRE